MPIDLTALARLPGLCRSPALAAELARAPSDAARVAIAEDTLHHHREDWAPEALGIRLRPPGDPGRVRLTLPLPAGRYHGARAADAVWTKPRE